MKKNYDWDSVWGMKYDQTLTEEVLKPFLCRLEENGLVGPVVFDIGCGAFPASAYLSGRNRLVCVDIAGEERVEHNKIKVRFDIGKWADSDSPETRRARSKIRAFLNIGQHDTLDGRVDTFILSNILNYFDYRQGIAQFRKLLRANGRLIVLNRPYKGGYFLASGRGLTNNSRFIEYLEGSGFLIEELQAWINPLFVKENEGAPLRDKNTFDFSLLMLSARKNVEERYYIDPDLFVLEDGRLVISKGDLRMETSQIPIIDFFKTVNGEKMTEYEFSRRAKAFFVEEERTVYSQVAMDYFFRLIGSNILEQVK